jgi:FkbM family methyltransferase
MFSVLAAAYFPGVPITCYEPDADNLVWLKRNLEVNHITATVVPQALWSRDVTLYYHPAESYTGHVDENPSPFPIPCTTPVIEEGCWLKLDIEGAEYEVMPEVLKRPGRPLMISMEIHEADTRGAGLVKLVESAGYEFRETPDLTANCINVEALQKSR